jgi:hypothetical protein
MMGPGGESECLCDLLSDGQCLLEQLSAPLDVRKMPITEMYIATHSTHIFWSTKKLAYPK